MSKAVESLIHETSRNEKYFAAVPDNVLAFRKNLTQLLERTTSFPKCAANESFLYLAGALTAAASAQRQGCAAVRGLNVSSRTAFWCTGTRASCQ